MRFASRSGPPAFRCSPFCHADTEALHAGDVGLSTASDSKILDFARQEGFIVVTLDADFHALLALSGASAPSVVRIRIEGLRAERLAMLLIGVLEMCADDLEKGAVVSVIENGIRVRGLRLLG